MTVLQNVEPMTVSARRARYARGRVDETRDNFNRRRLRAQLLVLILALSDVILIKSTWDIVLELPSWVSWMVATFTAVMGAALMWGAGLIAAQRSAYGGRLVTLPLFVLGWALLGAGVCYVRWNSGSLTDVALLGEGTVPTPVDATPHHVLALALTALYVAPGLLAFREAMDLGNPVAMHQRRTHTDLALVRQDLGVLEGAVLDSNEQLVRAREEIGAAQAAVVRALAANQALASELRAHARAEIARRIGDPAAGGITYPQIDPVAAPEPHHL